MRARIKNGSERGFIIQVRSDGMAVIPDQCMSVSK
jgi:hypothetical protein